MQIIVVSERFATAKCLTLTRRHFMASVFFVIALIVALSSLFSFVTLRHAEEVRVPIISDMIQAMRDTESARARQIVRENLNTMAVRLGQLQAQLVQLDSLGARLASLAGMEAMEEASSAGEGGPLVDAHDLTADQLDRELAKFALAMEDRNDYLGVLEQQLLDERTREAMMPSTLPVAGGTWNASGFGRRIDPFTGRGAMHEGVDFVASVGTSILAAAAGVVVDSKYHPAYGNLIEIDHGNGFSTRYAHASKREVEVGAFVRRGQEIAKVGSTGRSTGPHLHFEVRLNGVAKNPNRFLDVAKRNGQLVAANAH